MGCNDRKVESAMAIAERKSYCRVCGSGCGIIVETDGERVVKVRADEDHAVSRGYTCPKGRAVGIDHHRAERLEVPLIRRTERCGQRAGTMSSTISPPSSP